MSSNANANQVSFKINFTNKNEFRRITLENPTWDQFLSFVTESGRLQTTKEDGSRADPYVSYKDDDGDIIKVSTQIEFEEALLVLADKPVKTFFVSSYGSSPAPEASKEAPRSSSSSSSSSSSRKEDVPTFEIDIDLDPIMSLADEFFKNLSQHKETKESQPQQPQPQPQKNEEQPQRKPQFKFPIEEILKEVKGAENVLGDLFSSFAQNLPKGPKPQAQSSNSNDTNNNSRSQPGFENIFGPLGGIFQDILKQAQRPSSSSASSSSCSQDAIDSKDKQLYSEQLKTLKELGFTNEELNLAYLRSANGNVDRVAASLYEQAAY